MRWKNTSSKYGSAVIGLHWLTLLLVVAVYLCMELRGWVPKASAWRGTLKSLHFSLGLSVLALVTVRLAVRWATGASPPIAPLLSIWQQRLAGLGDVVLYAFLLVMPILGWFILSAKGTPILWFGMSLTKGWANRSSRCTKASPPSATFWWACMRWSLWRITTCAMTTRWCACFPFGDASEKVVSHDIRTQPCPHGATPRRPNWLVACRRFGRE